MTVLVWFGLRVALAASYLTLAVANPKVAGTLAFPYAASVFLVAVIDYIDARRARR